MYSFGKKKIKYLSVLLTTDFNANLNITPFLFFARQAF